MSIEDRLSALERRVTQIEDYGCVDCYGHERPDYEIHRCAKHQARRDAELGESQPSPPAPVCSTCRDGYEFICRHDCGCDCHRSKPLTGQELAEKHGFKPHGRGPTSPDGVIPYEAGAVAFQEAARALFHDILSDCQENSCVPHILEILTAAAAEGYRRGAEGMKEMAAKACDAYRLHAQAVFTEDIRGPAMMAGSDCARCIRALPLGPGKDGA